MHVIGYNTYMEYKTVRIWKNTLSKLRYIYAKTGESMIAIIDRLADQELKRIENADQTSIQNKTKFE